MASLKPGADRRAGTGGAGLGLSHPPGRRGGGTWAAGGAGPSLPVGVKDISHVVGQPIMMGAGFHDAQPATREGGSIAIMRAAGCAFVGKTVTTELGHRYPGPTRNPHNLAHTPGGSSSGSAAAVADFMVPLCLGTQTSGSIIRPAAYCGVIGTSRPIMISIRPGCWPTPHRWTPWASWRGPSTMSGCCGKSCWKPRRRVWSPLTWRRSAPPC